MRTGSDRKSFLIGSASDASPRDSTEMRDVPGHHLLGCSCNKSSHARLAVTERVNWPLGHEAARSWA